MANDKPFVPALIIVDVQNDFCPPSGSLAVPNGTAILPTITHLLTLPFPLKIATKDWHPPNHISFASNHPSATPFTSTTKITHPTDHSKSYETKLWPVHCVQNTSGAEIHPALTPYLPLSAQPSGQFLSNDDDAPKNTNNFPANENEHGGVKDGVNDGVDGTGQQIKNQSRITHIIHKGQNPSIEMYSALYDPFRIEDSGIVALLKEANVTDVYVVGLATDYCVKATAEDCAKEGYRTWVVEEGVRGVDEQGVPRCKKEMEGKGVRFVGVGDEDVARVKNFVSEEK